MKKIALFLLLTTSSFAKEIDVTQDLRIDQLLPRNQFIARLAIDPAVPGNFVAKTTALDFIWTYWGKESVLEDFFKNTISPKEPLLRVSISPEVIQDYPDGFNETRMRMDLLSDLEMKMESLTFGKIGKYPYAYLVTRAENKPMHLAWIGMNDPESRAVLRVNLVYPDEAGRPNKEDIALLEKFLKESQELPEPLFFKALGQEIHEGYTILNIADHKTKIIAEKRKSDKKIQFIVLPDEDTQFKFEEWTTGLMGASWHLGEPILKIRGYFTVNDDKIGTIIEGTIASILIKEVDKFTKPSHLQKNAYIAQCK